MIPAVFVLCLFSITMVSGYNVTVTNCPDPAVCCKDTTIFLKTTPFSLNKMEGSLNKFADNRH